MNAPNPDSIAGVLVWVIYVIGLTWILCAVLFVILLTWDEFQYRRRQRAERRSSPGENM